MKKLSDAEVVHLVEDACRNFKGQADVLTGAIGTLFLARMYGWRVARIAVSQATYRKYEKILGIQLQEITEERGDLASRSLGLAIADKLDDFWGVVQGRITRGDRPSRFDKKAIVDLTEESSV
jgi:hypothetical protein